MINRLSKFLRYTLENVSSQEVSLREEIETIELYLDIQQVRFKDRLTITMQISPDVLDALVPTLILQPLVENALRHGIGSSEAAGHLQISAERQNGTVHIHVSDDGPGIRGDWRGLQQKGVGLRNTLSRLEKLYGDSFSFDLLNCADRGAVVSFSIPYRRHAMNSPQEE
jgi:LytS/YehU family sensor histidine kinase